MLTYQSLLRIKRHRIPGGSPQRFEILGKIVSARIGVPESQRHQNPLDPVVVAVRSALNIWHSRCPRLASSSVGVGIRTTRQIRVSPRSSNTGIRIQQFEVESVGSATPRPTIHQVACGIDEPIVDTSQKPS